MNIFELQKIEEDIICREENVPDLINDRLYMGNMLNASDKETLKKIGITHILIFASYIEPQFPSDFTYKQIEVHDLPNCNIKSHFEESYNFVKDGLKHGSVFIHCAAGFSRSVACVIAFLMKENNWTYQQSYNYVKSKRGLKYTNPNFGFKQQLKDYENELNISNVDRS